MVGRKSLLCHALLALCVVAALSAAPADARRGGSFGSRGFRTFDAPPSTSLSPGYVPPVARSMTGRPAFGSAPFQPSPAYRPQYYPTSRPGMFGGFGGGLLTGLVTGGIIGGLMGHGFGGGWGGGGGGGLFIMLLQFALIAGGVWFVMRLIRGSRGMATQPPQVGRETSFGGNSFSPSPAYEAGVAAASETIEITLADADQQAFEHLLIELQEAFGHEDYGRLRSITTPEIMSYLSEELSQNATQGRRNDVTATKLLDGEISEAWREGSTDYATVSLRYESVDVMRDRATGAVLSGDPSGPTQTTELWTFVRQSNGWGSTWKVSAIQEA